MIDNNSTPRAIEWDESFKGRADPSGRAIANVHDSAYTANFTPQVRKYDSRLLHRERERLCYPSHPRSAEPFVFLSPFPFLSSSSMLPHMTHTQAESPTRSTKRKAAEATDGNGSKGKK